jgi:hypothetical protein
LFIAGSIVQFYIKIKHPRNKKNRKSNGDYDIEANLAYFDAQGKTVS